MSESNDMTCGELADVAAELALGVLTGRERAMAVAHLDRCDTCREDVRQLMATGEQLLELLPPAEPPAGFETRVLERLGLSVSAQPEPRDGVYPQLISAGEARADHHGAKRRGAGRSGTRSGADRPRAVQPGAGRPRGGQNSGGQNSAGQNSAPPAGPGGTRPAGKRGPGRMRRVLAATAIGLAVIVAGFGGWRIGQGASPPSNSAEGPLITASLRSGTGQDVGDVFFYSGESRWVYMSVDMDSAGNQAVICQLVSKDGQVTQIGTFRLADGYGSWGSPDPGNVGKLSGARLVTADGTLLATATFTA